MDVLEALDALTPEELLRVAEKLAPVLALIPTRSFATEYRADGSQVVQFAMKLGGEWRHLGAYTAGYGLGRTWIDPEPDCDQSAHCLARLHYQHCTAARLLREQCDLFAPVADAPPLDAAAAARQDNRPADVSGP